MSVAFQETIEKFVHTFENKQAQQEPEALHAEANGRQKILYFVSILLCLHVFLWGGCTGPETTSKLQRLTTCHWANDGFPPLSVIIWDFNNRSLYVQAGIKTDWQPKSWDTPTVRGKLPSFVLIRYFFDVASVVSGCLVWEETLQAKDFSSLFVKRSLL